MAVEGCRNATENKFFEDNPRANSTTVTGIASQTTVFRQQAGSSPSTL